MQTTFPDAEEAQVPLACDLSALDAECRSEHLERARNLLTAAPIERQEMPDGYAFRYAADAYPRIAEFIENERQCCPFFRFTLEIAPSQGPIWLHITGGDAVKEFLHAQLIEK